MLQEEFKKLKNLEETPITHRILKTIKTSARKSKDISKNENTNTSTNQSFHSNQLLRKNHSSFNKFGRTVEDSIGLKYIPAGHVINLGNKSFTKDV